MFERQLTKKCTGHSTFILDNPKELFKHILLRLESSTFYESRWQQGRMSEMRMNIKPLDMQKQWQPLLLRKSQSN